MGWMTSIFAVPRAMIYWRRDFEARGEQGPLGDLTFRLYRFSAGLGVIAAITGVWMAVLLGFPGWVWLKLGLVALLAVQYVWTGKMVMRARSGQFERGEGFLRIFNESSVFVVIAVLWVVVAQPF